MKEQLNKIVRRIRPQFGKLAVLLVGFTLGALVFSFRSCSSADPHADHLAEISTEGEQTIWTCSMHPQIRQPEPGQCPICGMDLIPVTARSEDRVEEANRVVLSERAQALARLTTATVQRRDDAAAQLRLLGRIQPDETTLRTVTAWTGGRIDRLRVNVTGERVRAGQVVATLYSPEVFAAHQDLLVAKSQVARLSRSLDSTQRAAAAALSAARQRLRLLGIPDDELARMESQERPTQAVAIRTPYAGTVIERMATEGAYVSTGTPLYRIANLKKLWVQLDAYENDLSRIAVGQKVQVVVDALPGQEVEGKVTFIDPTLDQKRRTAQIRVEINNPSGQLRPGMFVEATVKAGTATRETAKEERSPLLIPETAPLFTGRRAVVYVEVRNAERTVYEARTVRLGPRMGHFYPVVAGLSAGERVVTRGAFAIDADLQIRGGASMMTLPDDRQGELADMAIKLSATERAKLVPIVSAYLDIQEALAADNLKAAKKAALQLSTAATNLELERPAEAAAEWPALGSALRQHAQHVERSNELEGARSGFEALSARIETLLIRFGNPLDTPLRAAFCPMAAGSQGASWFQRGAEIHNSYFGESMRSCGEVRQQVAPGSYLEPAETDTQTPSKAAPPEASEHQH